MANVYPAVLRLNLIRTLLCIYGRGQINRFPQPGDWRHAWGNLFGAVVFETPYKKLTLLDKGCRSEQEIRQR